MSTKKGFDILNPNKTHKNKRTYLKLQSLDLELRLTSTCKLTMDKPSVVLDIIMDASFPRN